MDNLKRDVRKRVMSRNRGSGTRSTELRFRLLLVRSGVRGWSLGGQSGLPGAPDVIFPKDKLAVFLDGCFWHGCIKCRTIPVTNRRFWERKIGANRKRDRRVVRDLKVAGWKVVRVWEHELRDKHERVLANVRSLRRRT